MFSDMRAENFLSMYIYAEQLVVALQSNGINGLQAQEFTVAIPKFPFELRKLGLVLGRYLKYPWQMQRVKGEINHVADHSYGFLTYFLPRRTCVVTCHDLAPLFVPSNNAPGLLSKLLWLVALRGTLRATFIIADSAYTRCDLLKHSRYNPERIEVIYPGLEKRFAYLRGTPEQHQWEAAFRAEHDLDEAKVILHVGRYSQRKNFEGLLYTFAALQIKNPAQTVRLLQVGGKFIPAHYALMQELGISKSVIQIPYIPMDELPRVYNMAAALLFPSYYEGFGWPPLEAMACGAPVVTSNVTSIPEVVGEAALLFGPDDHAGMAVALHNLLTDPLLQTEMVRRGRHRAAEFSWQRCAEQVYAVYQKLAVTT